MSKRQGDTVILLLGLIACAVTQLVITSLENVVSIIIWTGVASAVAIAVCLTLSSKDQNV